MIFVDIFGKNVLQLGNSRKKQQFQSSLFQSRVRKIARGLCYDYCFWRFGPILEQFYYFWRF
jgi:hypothetical protein